MIHMHSIVAQEFEFSFSAGTSIEWFAVSFSTVVPLVLFVSELAAGSCDVGSSQLILKRVTRGSEARMLRTTWKKENNH